MKSNFILSLFLSGILSASGATSLPERHTVPVGQCTKTLNTSGHSLTKTPVSVSKAPALAPANAVEVPFTHDLGKGGKPTIDNYTQINANNDGRTWKYGAVNGYAACMPPSDAGVTNNDDWLVSVPVHMTPGNYVVSFEVGMMGSGATGVELEVKFGSEAKVEALTTEVAAKTVYTVRDMTKHEFNCAIGEEGYYYFGFHCTTSTTQKGTIKLANFGVRTGTVTPPVTIDPPAAGTLTWVLAPKGELKATVTYTAPTKTKSGAELKEISKVELTSRWGVDKYTFDNVQPGQVITQDVEMYAGINNRFTGVAYVGDKAGDMVEHKSIFCGPDTPFAPTDVTLTVDSDYRSATLSWTAPGETGEHGGYVDTDNLTYYIFDAFGTYYDPALFTTDRTSCTISYDDLEGQDFFAYQVTAGVGELYSLDTSSNIITAGTPAAMPFTESFAGGYYDGMWLIDPASSGGGTMNYGTITDEYFASLFDPEDPDAPEPLKSHDGDGGFYYWLPYEKDATLGLVSVRADISKADKPVLDFWYQGQGSRIDVLVAGGRNALEQVSTIDLKENPTTGWTLARIPLDAYKEQGAVQFEIRLKAVHNDDDHVWSVPFDNIRIHSLSDIDLGFVNFAAPSKTNPGEKVSLKAHVENTGTKSAENVTAKLSANGNIVHTAEIEVVPASGFADVNIDYVIPLNAPDEIELALTLEVDGESTPDDNIATTKLAVTRKPFATVTDLSAVTADGKVKLTWSEPVNNAGVPVTVTDDFESVDYTPLSITGCGGWTVYDGDGQRTYNIFRETNNPYQTAPMAFQLFNREEAGVPEQYWLDAQPYSGNSFMLAPSAQSAQNDNRLFSPKLSGNAQKVTFYAKSFTVAWPETIKVYYSTTGNAPEDFVNEVAVDGLPESRELPEEWTLYSVDLPDGATYFAIVHDSDDTLALMVDDVTYEGTPEIPADLSVEGYHVFRNGEQITENAVTTTAFEDAPVADGTPDGSYRFAYSVVPVYNYGAGHESNIAEVAVNHSGIDSIDTDTVHGTTVVYDIEGRHIDGRDLAPGYYIVVKDGKADKVLVK